MTDRAAPDATIAWTRALALSATVALLMLCLLWELWLAPTGRGTLAIKALPLLLPLPGLARLRLYTYRWTSLLVWLYVAEGAVRATSERGTGAWLAGFEVALATTDLRRLRRACPGPFPPGRGDCAMSDLLARLRDVVGAANLLAEGDLSTWEVDWRKRWRGKALAVARPGSTAEVAQVVRLCAEHGTPIVAQGGNTGLVGGSVPDASGRQLVLSLTRLDRVRGIDAANMTMTVEAGCVLQRAQQAAADAGLLLALSLGAEGSCTIGGNLATNAGGTQVLRYGNAREQCLGLEVVTAAGEIWDGLTGLRKDNTGYDLRDLMIGSEGTLGIITAATMKLQPRPAAVLTALATLPTLDAAISLLSLARSMLGPGLTGFEVMNAFSLDLVRKRFPALRQPLPPAPWTVLLEQSDAESESHGAAALEALLARSAGARPDRRHRDRLEPRAGACDVASARIDHPRPGRGRPEHQARHLAAGLGDPRFRRLDRRCPAARPARHPPGQLRPPRRRQPALQHSVPGRRRCR